MQISSQHVAVSLTAVTLLLIISVGYRMRTAGWEDSHRRMVSINRVEAGGLSPEIRKISELVQRLDDKLRELSGGDDGATIANVSVPLKDNTSSSALPGGDADAPFVRPRRPLLGQASHGEGNTADNVLQHGITDSIFVTIASYRDEQCPLTVQDLFAKARRPEALFIGVVEQNFPQDPPCMPKEYEKCQTSSDFCPSDHIQRRRILPNKARGPTFGRYYGMRMYRGETYLFMMDSHNRFVTHWDAIIVKMYKGLPTDKGVLSHYPEAWNNPEDKGATNPPLDHRSTTTYLCTSKFVPEFGFVRFDGFVVHKTTKPRPQPYAAAGFLFADARIIFDIPFDPHLSYIFDGEEITYSVRMWTHGWDIFSPNENIMYHYYYRTKAKKFWSLLPHDWVMHRDRAVRRIQYLLNVTKQGTEERVVPLDTKEEWVLAELDKYGLGKVRTLQQYWEFAGIDMVKRTVENKFCPKA